MIIRCKDCGRSSYRKNLQESCVCQQTSKDKAHTEAINYIQKALKSLGNDSLSYEARKSLMIGLNKLTKKKQPSTPAQQMHQKGINIHTEWWSKIETAVRQSQAVPPEE